MYAKIIVPYDGSKRALAPLPFAEVLAAGWGCAIEVVQVAADGEPPLKVDEVAHEVRRVPGEDPAAALITEVRATEPPGLLCMSTRGRTALGDLAFGTVTGRVIRGLHAPLVVTGPELIAQARLPALRRLLVCLDGSTTSAVILPIVRGWAVALDLEVLLLHVAYPTVDPTVGQVTVPEETRVITAELERTTHDLDRSGIKARWQVVEDTWPATGIVRQAAHRAASVVVMATHGRRGLARMLSGSVTAEVVRHAPVPVLTLRPSRLS